MNTRKSHLRTETISIIADLTDDVKQFINNGYK